MPTYTSEHPIFSVTVDLVVLTVQDDALRVLMVTRRDDPYAGRLALPGGFVEPEEDLADAARRELEEETGLTDVVFEQLASYGAPGRDPRGRIVSVAHLAVLPAPTAARGADDASDAGWYPVEPLLRDSTRVAFDHRTILSDAVERVRGRLEHTARATAFLQAELTLAQLRSLHESTHAVTVSRPRPS
jgi:8-oxo-dGTP diphosphatase